MNLALSFSYTLLLGVIAFVSLFLVSTTFQRMPKMFHTISSSRIISTPTFYQLPIRYLAVFCFEFHNKYRLYSGSEDMSSRRYHSVVAILALTFRTKERMKFTFVICRFIIL